MRFLYICFISCGLLLTACGQQKQDTGESATEAAEASEETEGKIASSDTTSADKWQIRLDYPSRKSKDDITIEDTAQGYRIKTGPRAIYYKNGMNASVPYQLSATFTQNNDPGPEAYGLFVGGENLQDKDLHYLYFLIRQTGEYLIKRRVGDKTEMVVDWTAHDVIESTKEKEKPVNTLAVHAESDSLYFMVNDQQVEALSQEKVQYVDGQTGLRVNHRLDVTVEDISLSTE